YTYAWVPSLVLLVLVVARDELRSLLRWLLASVPRLVLCATVVTALALPHLGVMLEPAASGTLFSFDRACPRDPRLLHGSKFLDCIDHLAWEKPPVLRTALDVVDDSAR